MAELQEEEIMLKEQNQFAMKQEGGNGDGDIDTADIFEETNLAGATTEDIMFAKLMKETE